MKLHRDLRDVEIGGETVTISDLVVDVAGVQQFASNTVAPGGTLLVIGHQGHPSWHEDLPAHVTFPGAEDVMASLDVEGWTVERAEAVHVELAAPDGSPGNRTDNLVRLRRPREG